MSDKPTKKTGRSSKFTPETCDRVLQAINAGNYLEVAANYAGIGVSTLHRWLSEADEPDAPQALQEFREAVQRAKAQTELRNVALIQKAAQDGTWQAAAWFLERSAPHRWGRMQRVELTGEGGGPVQVEHRATLLDKLTAMRERATELIDTTATDEPDDTELRAIG